MYEKHGNDIKRQSYVYVDVRNVTDDTRKKEKGGKT